MKKIVEHKKIIISIIIVIGLLGVLYYLYNKWKQQQSGVTHETKTIVNDTNTAIKSLDNYTPASVDISGMTVQQKQILKKSLGGVTLAGEGRG